MYINDIEKEAVNMLTDVEKNYLKSENKVITLAEYFNCQS
jgi:hypothetical protein